MCFSKQRCGVIASAFHFVFIFIAWIVSHQFFKCNIGKWLIFLFHYFLLNLTQYIPVEGRLLLLKIEFCLERHKWQMNGWCVLCQWLASEPRSEHEPPICIRLEKFYCWIKCRNCHFILPRFSLTDLSTYVKVCVIRTCNAATAHKIWKSKDWYTCEQRNITLYECCQNEFTVTSLFVF